MVAGIEVAQRVDRIAGGRGGTAGTALWLVLVRAVPLTRYLMVVQGASTMLSWSMPIMFAPLRLSTPTTRKETLLMRISLPSGDVVREQVPLDGVADHADLGCRCGRRGR